MGNVLQPRVRDLLAVTQVQAGELREVGNVLQPHVRDLLAVPQVQADFPVNWFVSEAMLFFVSICAMEFQQKTSACCRASKDIVIHFLP